MQLARTDRREHEVELRATDRSGRPTARPSEKGAERLEEGKACYDVTFFVFRAWVAHG